MKPWRPFTPAEDAELLAMAARGKTDSEIARALSRHPSGVSYRRNLLMDRPPTGAARSGKVANRTCLRCGKRFKSAGYMNRLCVRCNSAVSGLPAQFVWVSA